MIDFGNAIQEGLIDGFAMLCGCTMHLRQIRVLAVVVDTPEELRVRVESTVRRPRCPHCGFNCHRVHDSCVREVR